MLTGSRPAHLEAEDGDGDAALAAVAEDDVDLVLADLRIPGTDGMALLDQLPALCADDSSPPLRRVQQPPRAAALLRKDELTRERLAFTIRRVSREVR